MTIDFHLWRQNTAGGQDASAPGWRRVQLGDFAHAAPRQLAAIVIQYTATDDDDFGGCTRIDLFCSQTSVAMVSCQLSVESLMLNLF